MWSWMLCRGFCLLSLSEEPCSSHPPARDPRLPLRSQGTFPMGQDWGWHGILHHPYLCPGRTHGGAAAGGTGVGTNDARFSICCQLCPPVHNKKFPLSVGAPAWLSLPRPSLQGELNSPCSCFSIWQRSPFARGCLAQAAAGVCHPWVQAGCACPGQPRRELCVRQLLCWLLGSFLIFTSTPDTRLCVASSPLLRSDCRPAAHAAG